MTDQTIPADKVRDLRDQYTRLIEDAGTKETRAYYGHVVKDLDALLPAPPRPTLADMNEEERRECKWMQADVKGRSARYVIATPSDRNGLAGLVSADGGIEWTYPDRVTPRPDLPRMGWPDADQDGEEVTKVDYVSVEGGGTEYGPWTVARLPKKAGTVPDLPDGWRLADHEEHGRVIVTTTIPTRSGRACFVTSADAPLGFDWHFCTPDELTYIDTEPDPSTLAEGSVWDDADALARACEESGRDQIVVSEKSGYVFVWDDVAGWWKGSAMPRFAPYTIIHIGQEADQ